MPRPIDVRVGTATLCQHRPTPQLQNSQLSSFPGYSPPQEQGGSIEKGWPDVAVALVLEGFPIRTLLEPMPQRHWATPDRAAGGDDGTVPAYVKSPYDVRSLSGRGRGNSFK